MIWPAWYAQTLAWAVACGAMGVVLYLCGLALKEGMRMLLVHMGWNAAFWDWIHHVWIPRYRAAQKAKKGGRSA